MSDIGRGIAASAPARVAATPVRAPMLARKCSCSGSDASCSKCAEEEMRGAVLHRKAMGGMTPGRIPDIVGRVLSSPGRPLDRDTRAEMESRFGHDFSAVRIHSGADAAASAHAVGAHAYTVGSDIVVGSNHDLHSPRGMRLLAHELTHTIQQRGVARVAVDSLPIAAADHSSEREADAVADAVMSGDEVRAPAVARHGLAMLSRLTETETIPETPGAKDALKLNAIAPADDFKSPDDTSIRWFRVTVPFPLPAEKGPRALSIWQGAAEAGEKSKTSLHMILDAKGNFKAALKATRSLTGTLRKMWLLSVGWPSDSATATKNWNDAGGSATDFFARSLVKVPKKDDDDGEVDAIDQADPVPAPVAEGETPKPPATLKACQFDHVVELQAGGPDASSNLALLSGADNVRSAVLITKELRLRVSQIRAVYPDLQQVGLIYSTVAQQGSPSCSEACCRIETKARAARAKLEADAAAAGTKLSSVPHGPDEKEYPLSAGKFSGVAVVPKKFDAPVQLHESETNSANALVSRLVPGLELKTLRPKNFIDATVDERSRKLITLKAESNVVLTVAKGGAILVDKSKPNLAFTFPYLSDGVIDHFHAAPDGLHASGTITPSLPLLKGSLLDFTMTPESIAATIKPKTPLKSPVPGLKLLDPKLSLPLWPQFKPEGSIGFAIGGDVVTGALVITVNGTELVGTADVRTRIPGLDEDTGGKVTYANGHWSAAIHLSKSGKNFVKNASIDVLINDDGLTAAGSIDVVPPGGSVVTLTIARDEKGNLTYTGHGTVEVGLADPVALDLGYSAAGLTADGKADFALKSLGAKGTLHVVYDSDLGFVGTVSNFRFKRGLANVTLDKLTLAKKKFTGSGSIEMPVGKSFIARGAVTLDEKQNLAITAALRIAQPIVLFDAFGGNYNILTLPAIKIPIPGASIAGIGLKLEILGGIQAGYLIGPGRIEEAEIAAGINPLQATTAAGAMLKARLLIPAQASITGSITGLVALDAWIADVAGGLTVSATATLAGGLDARTEVGYSPERLVIDAKLDAALKLLLSLGLDAVVRASVLTKKYETRWNLGKWPFDPGVSLSIGGAFHYESDKPFKAPALTFNKPALDGKKLVTGPFGGAAPKEKTA